MERLITNRLPRIPQPLRHAVNRLMHHLQHALVVWLLAQLAQQGDLQAAQRVQIRDAQRQAAGERAVVGEQGFGLQNIQQGFQAALVFGFIFTLPLYKSFLFLSSSYSLRSQSRLNPGGNPSLPIFKSMENCDFGYY